MHTLRLRLRPAAVALGLAVALTGCGGEDPTGSLDLRALASPICPVETSPPDPACAPKPIAIRVVVLDGDGRQVAVTTTRVDGAPIRMSLRQGRYRLVGEDPGPPSVQEQEATIGAEPVAVTLSVDTGIR